MLEFSGNNLTPCMKRDGKPLTGAAYFAALQRDDVGALVVAAGAHEIPVLVVGAPSFPARENVPDRVGINAGVPCGRRRESGCATAEHADVSP